MTETVGGARRWRSAYAFICGNPHSWLETSLGLLTTLIVTLEIASESSEKSTESSIGHEFAGRHERFCGSDSQRSHRGEEAEE